MAAMASVLSFQSGSRAFGRLGSACYGMRTSALCCRCLWISASVPQLTLECPSEATLQDWLQRIHAAVAQQHRR